MSARATALSALRSSSTHSASSATVPVVGGPGWVRPSHDLQQALEKDRTRVSMVYGLEKPHSVVGGRSQLRKHWTPILKKKSLHPFAKTVDGLDTKGIASVDSLANDTWREYPSRGAKVSGIFRDFDRRDVSARMPTAGMRETFRQRAVAERAVSVPPGSSASMGNADELSAEFAAGLFAHPDYSPDRTVGQLRNQQSFLSLRAKEGKLKENGVPIPAEQDNGRDLAFRIQTMRSSKYGIEFGQKPGRQILFEMSGMDTNAAADEKLPVRTLPVTGRSDSDGNQLRSITNAELRKAFRHDVSDESLSFFESGNTAEAPWLNSKSDVWKSYLRERWKKYGIPNQPMPDPQSRLDFRKVNLHLNQRKNARRRPIAKL